MKYWMNEVTRKKKLKQIFVRRKKATNNRWLNKNDLWQIRLWLSTWINLRGECVLRCIVSFEIRRAKIVFLIFNRIYCKYSNLQLFRNLDVNILLCNLLDKLILILGLSSISRLLKQLCFPKVSISMKLLFNNRKFDALIGLMDNDAVAEDSGGHPGSVISNLKDQILPYKILVCLFVLLFLNKIHWSRLLDGNSLIPFDNN